MSKSTEHTQAVDVRELIEASLRYFGMSTTYSEQATKHVLSDISAAGYVIVPREPTKAMIAAGCSVEVRDMEGVYFDMESEDAILAYTAMISAAEKGE